MSDPVKTYTSPDMVKLSDVLDVLTSNQKVFKEAGLATVVRSINNLRKYDLKPVSDTINNTNVNVIAETSKVRQFLKDLKENLG